MHPGVRGPPIPTLLPRSLLPASTNRMRQVCNSWGRGGPKTPAVGRPKSLSPSGLKIFFRPPIFFLLRALVRGDGVAVEAGKNGSVGPVPGAVPGWQAGTHGRLRESARPRCARPLPCRARRRTRGNSGPFFGGVVLRSWVGGLDRKGAASRSVSGVLSFVESLMKLARSHWSGGVRVLRSRSDRRPATRPTGRILRRGSRPAQPPGRPRPGRDGRHAARRSKVVRLARAAQ
jgi:hypothetical protein